MLNYLSPILEVKVRERDRDSSRGSQDSIPHIPTEISDHSTAIEARHEVTNDDISSLIPANQTWDHAHTI